MESDTPWVPFKKEMWIGEGRRKSMMEFMPNCLYSPRLQIMWVWFPKCACSMLRTLFLEIHRILNPSFDIQYPDLDIHKLHRKRRFRYINQEITPVKHVFLLMRHPFKRLVSTFLDKHVLQRQWHYTCRHQYRRFRMYLDIHNLPHTFDTFVSFLQKYGHIDIHDCPQVYQVPSFFWTHQTTENPPTFHMYVMEDTQWKKKFFNDMASVIKNQKVLTERRILLHQMMQNILNTRINSISSAQEHDHDKRHDCVVTSHSRVVDLRRHVSEIGNDVVSGFQQSQDQIRDLYKADDMMYAHVASQKKGDSHVSDLQKMWAQAQSQCPHLDEQVIWERHMKHTRDIYHHMNPSRP